MSNDIKALESILNKTDKDNKFIRKEFFFIDHDYKLTRPREMKELRWLLVFGIPYGLVFLGIGLLMAFKGSSGFKIFSPFMLAFGTYAWLPGLLLHLQYKNDAADLTVRVTKGSKQIIVHSLGAKKVLEKADIASVTKVQNPAYKNPWSDYGYTEIKFKTGEIINLTNLVVDQLLILNKFAHDSITTKTINRIIPRIVNKSRVNWQNYESLL